MAKVFRKGPCGILVVKGSMEKMIELWMTNAGLPIWFSGRCLQGEIGEETLYPPDLRWAIKARPQDVPRRLLDGDSLLGFTGTDLLRDSGLEDRFTIVWKVSMGRAGGKTTKIVCAVPDGSTIASANDFRPAHRIVTEFPEATRRWLIEAGLQELPKIIRTAGATEGFCNADAVVEITESGSSLRENGLTVIATVMVAELVLITPKEALTNPEHAARAEELRDRLEGVVRALDHYMLEFNVEDPGRKDALVAALGCPRPTISQLHGGGLEVKALVPREGIEGLKSRLKRLGASSLLHYEVLGHRA